MELLFLALLFAASSAGKSANDFPLQKLLDLLENDNLKKFADDKRLRSLQLGAIRGQDIANALQTLQALSAQFKTIRSLSGGALPDLKELSRMILSAQSQDTPFSALFRADPSPAPAECAQADSLAPIARIADKEIIFALTRYFFE